MFRPVIPEIQKIDVWKRLEELLPKETYTEIRSALNFTEPYYRALREGLNKHTPYQWSAFHLNLYHNAFTECGEILAYAKLKKEVLEEVATLLAEHARRTSHSSISSLTKGRRSVDVYQQATYEMSAWEQRVPQLKEYVLAKVYRARRTKPKETPWQQCLAWLALFRSAHWLVRFTTGTLGLVSSILALFWAYP